jgi:acyl-CoA thioesterase
VAASGGHRASPGDRAGGPPAGRGLGDRGGGPPVDRAVGTATGYSFDLATAVAGGPERWTARVDPGWTVAGRPNGGYLLALATRAALGAAGQPHPLAVSAHFLAPPEPGPAELGVARLRAGRSLATARVALVQEGTARLEALVTAGRIGPDAAPGWRRATGPAGLPPLEDCLPARPELPGGVRANLLDHVELRIDPATAGWVAGHPGGSLDVRGWVRFADGRPADPLALLQVVDALPPASFDLGLPGWAPTVELTVYLRGLPAPGWLGCVVRGQLWQDGWFDEEAEVWDSAGRLVAQSRQFAGARPAAPSGDAREPS